MEEDWYTTQDSVQQEDKPSEDNLEKEKESDEVTRLVEETKELEEKAMKDSSSEKVEEDIKNTIIQGVDRIEDIPKGKEKDYGL